MSDYYKKYLKYKNKYFNLKLQLGGEVGEEGKEGKVGKEGDKVEKLLEKLKTNINNINEDLDTFYKNDQSSNDVKEVLSGGGILYTTIVKHYGEMLINYNKVSKLLKKDIDGELRNKIINYDKQLISIHDMLKSNLEEEKLFYDSKFIKMLEEINTIIVEIGALMKIELKKRESISVI